MSSRKVIKCVTARENSSYWPTFEKCMSISQQLIPIYITTVHKNNALIASKLLGVWTPTCHNEWLPSFFYVKPCNLHHYNITGHYTSFILTSTVILSFQIQCNPLISTFYISTFLYIHMFSNSRICPSISLLKKFSYIDLLYLLTLIYRHFFGKA